MNNVACARRPTALLILTDGVPVHLTTVDPCAVSAPVPQVTLNTYSPITHFLSRSSRAGRRGIDFILAAGPDKRPVHGRTLESQLNVMASSMHDARARLARTATAAGSSVNVTAAAP